MVVVLHALFGKNSGYGTHWRGVWVKVYTNNRALLLSPSPLSKFFLMPLLIHFSVKIYEYDATVARPLIYICQLCINSMPLF